MTLVELQSEDDAEGQLDWEVHLVDGSVVRAHQHAVGAKKRHPAPKPKGAVAAASAPRSTCGRTARVA
jgi:hypothetical protein